MDFYRRNSFVDILENAKSYKILKEGQWLLVYGDRENKPKVLIYLSEYDNLNYENRSLKHDESEFLLYTEKLSKISNIPYLYVRFNKDFQILNEVMIMEHGRFLKLTIDEYKEIIIRYGIIKNNKISKKQINSKASSVYHVWQMNCGLDITTSDIDLFKVDKDSNILEILELKRSIIKMDDWEPFVADYNNFRLISNVIYQTNISFYIIFNDYYKKPVYYDDPSLLKIYKVEHVANDINIVLLKNRVKFTDYILNGLY